MDVKSSTIYGSAATDSSSLRRSTRETSAKKIRTSSPSSQKSERLEDQTLSSIFNKKKSVKVEKKRPSSPLRRSERIGGSLSSSGSKKSNSISSSLGRKITKNSKSGKIAVADTKEQRKDNKLDIKSRELFKKKTRMDARTYRALFKKAKSSEADNNHPKEVSESQGNTCHAGASDPNKVQEGGDECNERKEEDLRRKLSDDDCKKAAEGSSSGSGELAELNLRNDGRRRYARLSMKQKYEDRPSVSKCSRSSLPSSPVGLTSKENDGGSVEREIDGESDGYDAYELVREELGTPELAASTSEERSLPVDIDPESGGDFGGSKSAKMAADLNYDISVTALDRHIHNTETSPADAASSSPSGTKSKNMEQCIVCSKLQKVQNDSQAQDLCSCNAQKRHDLLISISEEACEPVATLGNPREGEIVAMSSQENGAKGFPVPETREQSSGSKEQNCLVASPSPKHVSGPMAEDRGRHGVSDSTSIAEHLSSTHPEESSVAIQTDTGPNACVVCNHPELLLCCDGNGCKRSYHLSCLDLPLQDVPPGVWLCHICVRKKVESGVHSVSEGIESVWDIKGGMQNGKHYLVKYKGLAHVHNRWIPESQMLLEAPMLVAKFNSRHQKEKVTRWKQEWTQPHRLLHKRLLMPQNLSDVDGHGNGFSYCYHEWFVKWKGLGYEYATWEFENSPFLCSNEATMLIKDYESRQEEANKASDPWRADMVKKNPFHKLTRLPDGCPAGLDNDHLISINRLCEFWHKSQNAVFIDDQEWIIKSILFISVLQSHTCRPFLIISAIASLSLWETEFIHFAPSINVVVDNGNKDVRKMIRTLEFYKGGGSILFQVLLSHPDAIVEDLEAVDCIGWEAVIVDECQNSGVSKHLELFRKFSTDFRLLLLSGQLKDNLAEYLILLSFLDSGGKQHGVNSLKFGSDDTAGSLAILKERFARYLAYERKTDSSKFLEYWVPVRLSNVQLEQYCATLVSNSIALRACSKVDHVGALRDILISTRKCCDHPYLVDQLLQSSLTKGLTPDKYLDIGVKASGKLLLLDKILHEIKNQGLRVLILFQKSIGGAGRNSIGDILDDFIRQRFGADSYERVDSGLIMSKKLAALNMFNDKARGRFVFLLENRACLPSIKLSSVDAVIIFDSDWNPLNDLRALQKISIESQFEQVKVFRLYSSCTVEEKLLIFAKQDMILENNIQNISPSISHMLLSWGAFYLFSELDEFHRHDNLSNHSEIYNDSLFLNDAKLEFLNDVVLEFLKQLPKNAESSNTGNCSIIIKAQQSGASYSRNINLVGEKEGIFSLDKDPHSFWSNLLERRYPKWRYVSEPSQRIRRKVQQYLEESTKVSEVENDEMKKKRRKATSNTVDPISLQTWLQDKTKGTTAGRDAMVPDDNLPAPHFFKPVVLISPQKTPAIPCNMPKEPEAYGSQAKVGSQCMSSSAGHLNNVIHNWNGCSMSDDTSELHKSHMVESDGREKLRRAQRSLHISLKPELSKLCDTLKLPEDVNSMADRFLEYIMNNHLVSRESETVLQAFLISLCWRAASFLKHRVDHKECLALAKKHLNFVCNEEQAGSVYSKLRMLKKIFSQTSALRNEKESSSLDNQSSASIKVDVVREQMQGGTSKSAASGLQESGGEIRVSPYGMCSERLSLVQVQAPVLETQGEIRESPHGSMPSEQLSLEQAPVLEIPSKMQQHLGSLKDELLKKRIDLIDKIYLRREDELLQKQRVEVSDFNIQKEEEKIKLKSSHDLDLDVIRSIHIDLTVRNDKIKLLNQEFSKKMAEFDQHMKHQRKKLTVMQIDARNKEREIRDLWLEEAKTGTLAESFDNLPLPESGFRLEEFKEVGKQVEACVGPGNIISVSKSASDQMCIDMITTGPGESIKSTVKHSEIPSNIPNGRVENVLVETETAASQSNIISEVESIEPNGTSAEISATALPGGAGHMSIETETPPSQSDVMNAAGNGLDAMLIISTERTLEGEDNSHDTCLVSSPQPNRTEHPSSAHALINSGRGNSLSYNQFLPSIISSVENCQGSTPALLGSEEELCIPGTLRFTQQAEVSTQQPIAAASVQLKNFQGSTPALLGSEDDPCIRGTLCSTQQTEVSMQQPILAAAVQAEQSNQLGSHSFVHPLPPYANIPSERTHSEEEPRIQGTHCSTQQTEVLMLQPILAAAVQAVQSSQLGLQSVRHPLPPFANMPSERTSPEEEPCIQGTHCSTQQNEVSMQQPIVAAAVQSEQPNQLVSQSVVHPLPPCANMSSERTRSEEPCIHATHCSTQENEEVLMQRLIVAAAVQAEQSNQLVSQSVVHPLPPYANMPPERTRSEDLRSPNVQPEPGSRLLQIFRMLPCVPPQGLHPDPLQNELIRICKQEEICTKMFEDKKLQLKLECDQEIEKVRRKFDALRQDAETIFSQDKKIFDATKSKIRMNLVLAGDFRAKFIENKGGASSSFQGHRSSSSMQQFHHASQPPPSLRPSSACPPVLVPTPTTLPPVPAPTTARQRAPVPAVASVPSGPVARHTSSVIPSAQVRSHFSHALPTRANLQVGSEPRAPAPHLHRFRPQTSLPAPNHLLQTGQMPTLQQLISNLGPATSLSTPVAPIPLANPSMVPVSGYCQPIAQVFLPVCRGMPSPSAALPLDVGDSYVGTDPLNLSQFMEVDPSFDRWLSSNWPPMGNDVGSSSMVGARPTAAADVVCLSDDD